jgi:hypothetical protein
MWSLNDPCVDRVITFTEAGAGATVLKVGCSAGAGNVGLDYSSSLSAAGGTPPYTFSVSGSLPAGLTLNAAGGAISGTPTAAGASSFTVNAADAASNTGSAACTIVISAPCTAIIDGPADVPGLSAYKYAIDLPAAPAPTNIAWSVDQPTASLPGPTNLTSATVEFANTQADFITVLARFTLNGTQRGGTKQVALVKVDVGQAVFTTPGKADGVNDGSVYPFLVNAPPPGTGYVPSPLCAGLVVPLPPPGPFWVLPPLTPTATYPAPGMAWNCFVYDGPSQAAELQVREESDGAGGPAFLATCTVTLTSPAQKPTAQQNIQVGFIQHLVAVSGTASYPSKVSLNQNLTRIVTTPPTPTPTTVDWLSSTDSPPALNGDQWPWYDPGQRAACPAGNQSQVGKAPDTVNVVRYLSDVLAQHGFLVAFD